MPEWEGFLLCAGIACAMLVIFCLCVSLVDCSPMQAEQDASVLDEWCGDMDALNQGGTAPRLTQMEGASVTAADGTQTGGLTVTGDGILYTLQYNSDTDTLTVCCGDTLYIYSPDRNTLCGQDADAAALRGLMSLYFTAAEAKGNRESGFSADKPGSWDYIQAADPALYAEAWLKECTDTGAADGTLTEAGSQ